MVRILAFGLLFLPSAITSVSAVEVDYVRDIKPIFKARCFACHGSLKQKSELRLDTAASIRRGGEGGSAIEAGKSAASLLIERVMASDLDERMPPEGEPLTARQIELIKAWIDQGAIAPAHEQPEEDARRHWAFQPPRSPMIPAVKNAEWRGNPIDSFIAAEHERLGLKPVAPVEKALLLRRVHLDLIGLPPTHDQLRAFLADTREDAYEQVVDRLLRSPHYGERWGRHWMDVWRYSDWFGLGDQLRYSQKHIWHWRDWIVESLNADKGYDRMVLEMLAADEIAPADRDALRATGFLARNYFLFNRTTWLDDTIEHTSKAMLGLTMNCAKCHDHKYDPITQIDYYRMRAIFEPHQVRLDPEPGELDLEKDGLPRAFDAHPDAATYLHIRGDAKNPDTSRVIRPGPPAILTSDAFAVAQIDLPPEAHNPALQQFVLEDHLRVVDAEIAAARQGLSRAKQQLVVVQEAANAVAEATANLALAETALAAAELRPAALRAAHAADVARHQVTSPENLRQLIHDAASAARRYEYAKAEEAVVRAEQKAASADAKQRSAGEQELKSAREVLAKAKAALEDPGEKYTSLRASLKALEGPDETDASRRRPYPTISTGRRAALARWIANPNNPLTARVAVNHIWSRHFGQPLVESVTDFGLRAKRLHQHALLDWLAVELMKNDWSMKHLHRLIVTSRTFRLSTSSSGVDAATKDADPRNDYYWRRTPARMESQLIRDSLLHLAGVLNPQMGGPTIDPGNEDTTFRRSIYFTHSRDSQHTFLAMFDDADILRCYRRTESIIPQQALTLANSKLALSMARKIAKRLGQDEAPDDEPPNDEVFVRRVFETVLCREPDREEMQQSIEALVELRELLEQTNRSEAEQRARADFVHAILNHNDFVTIR